MPCFSVTNQCDLRATQGQEEGLSYSLSIELWRSFIPELKKGTIISAFASWRLQKDKYFCVVGFLCMYVWNVENPVQVYKLFSSFSVRNGKDNKEMVPAVICLLLHICADQRKQSKKGQ